jgi:hypothetical protein
VSLDVLPVRAAGCHWVAPFLIVANVRTAGEIRKARLEISSRASLPYIVNVIVRGLLF